MGFIVDLFLKGKLLYNLQSHKFLVTVNNTVAMLRKPLIKAIKDCVPIKWKNLTTLRVTIELDNCQERTVEFQGLVVSVDQIKEAVGLHQLKEGVSNLKWQLNRLLEN